ncbi:DNA cytosine methyltransferase [candidate division KSB1 bacterium]|nr:DNA cytosine methyltransferase [candidate division KSB1 bacterium]
MNAIAVKRNYADTLEQTWLDHLRERASDAPTVISTFAGCGGSSLGYSMAGFRELLAVEWDKHAVAVFRANFPDVPVFHGDIAKLSVEECLEMAGIQKGELDVLDSSPPCQGYSTAGKRAFTDARNTLFTEFVRLLRGLQPKVFVMENVSGLVKGKMKLIFAEMLRELKASGYQVSARLLNAAYYGVPQSRQRLIVIGVRNDLGISPTHPVGCYAPVSVRQALVDCEPSEIVPVAGKNLRMIARLKPAASGTERNRAAVQVFGKVRNFNFIRLKWSRPSPTIPKTMRVSETFGAGLVMPDDNRYVSIAELKRLGSFPDAFKFVGSFEHKWARIGNSVPPLLMRAIAQHIRQELLCKCSGSRFKSAAIRCQDSG